MVSLFTIKPMAHETWHQTTIVLALFFTWIWLRCNQDELPEHSNQPGVCPCPTTDTLDGSYYSHRAPGWLSPSFHTFNRAINKSVQCNISEASIKGTIGRGGFLTSQLASYEFILLLLGYTSEGFHWPLPDLVNGEAVFRTTHNQLA